MPNLYNVPLENGVQLTLQNALLTAETGTITFTATVTSKLQASSTIPGILVIDRVDSNGTETPTKTEYISFTGVTGSTVTGLTRGLANTTAQDHSAGAVVEFVPDVIWADAINDTFTVEHNADGTHKTISLISLSSVTLNNPVINFGTGILSNVTLVNPTIAGGGFASIALTNVFISGNSLVSTNISNSILDTFTFNTNNVALLSNVSGAVNQTTIQNSLTSLAPKISATGTDTNISLQLTGKGTGRIYPQLQSDYASCSSTLTVSSTSYADIPGLTFTFTPAVNSYCFITTFLDIETASTSTAVVGALNVNGSREATPTVIWQAANRGTVGANWRISMTANTSYTIKMQGARAFGSANGTISSGNSTFSYFLVAQ